MKRQRGNRYAVSGLTVRIVWATKYRYKVLQGDMKVACRKVIMECRGCYYIKGVVSQDYIHLHINYLPSKSISDLVKKLKGRSSRCLQQDFSELKKKYWG